MSHEASERLSSILHATLRRGQSLLDPRTRVVYYRAVVDGRLPGAIESNDAASVAQLARAADYERVGDREFDHSVWGVPLGRLRLRAESDGGTPRLVQEFSLSGWVAYVLLGAVLATFFWIYLPFPIGWILLAVTFSVFGSFLVGFLFVPSPLARYLDILRSEEEYDLGDDRVQTLDPATYRASCVGPPAVALLGGLTATGPVFLTGLPILLREVRRSPYIATQSVDTWLVFPAVGAAWMLGFWALGLTVGLFVYTFEEETTRIRLFPFDLLARASTPIPELTGGYLSLFGLATTPVVALTQSSFLLPAAHRLSSLRTVAYFFLPATILAATLPVFLYWWVIHNREYVYGMTLDQLGEIESPRRRFAVAVVVSIASSVFAVSLVLFFQKFRSYLVAPILNQNPEPVLQLPFVVGILLVSLLPAAYLLVGVGYQAVDFVVGTFVVWLRSVPVGRTPNGGVQVRFTDTEEPRVQAVAVGPVRFVVVSRGAWRKVSEDREAFAALLAHEEAHLRNKGLSPSDAQIASILSVVGTVTLTGKNILYALADFRQREDEADDYAAAVTSERAVQRAIQYLDDSDRPVSPPSVSLLIRSGPGSLAAPNSVDAAVERYFGLLFGDFALTRVHRNRPERLARLED